MTTAGETEILSTRTDHEISPGTPQVLELADGTRLVLEGVPAEGGRVSASETSLNLTGALSLAGAPFGGYVRTKADHELVTR